MTTLANPWLNSPWPGLAVWIALFISDYSFTLACARLYQAGVGEKIVFEGSFEITPYFQRDIDSLRVVSPRFLVALLRSGALLVLVWWLSRQTQPEMYQFTLGAMISVQLAIHVRHLRNLFLFRAMIGTDAVRGRIEYSRQMVLRMSAVELLAFSGLFALLFVFTQSWFVLGGASACLVTAWKHQRLARKHVSVEPSSVSPRQKPAPEQ